MEQDAVKAGVQVFALSTSYTVNPRAPNLGHFITIKELVVVSDKN